ncbi:unknown [Fusobacterium sp. CAG:439]|nr:unknown [Fusobacterium sp. CAG:439]
MTTFKKYSFKSAFTLAEVLVTLGIIGVVSAMTVPTLIQNHQRKTYVTQLHKVYNEISQVLLQYQTDKNALNLREAGLISQNAVDDMIRSYFKVVQECDSMSPCFAERYRKLDGSMEHEDMFSRDRNAYVLTSGASIRPSYYAEGPNKIVNMAVDINGAKGPNVQGRDLFWLYIYNNGQVDDFGDDVNVNAPLTKDEREAIYKKYCMTTEDSGSNGCFGRILNDNWEMTY